MKNEEIFTTLDKILPVVDRVHGEHHPELHEVLSLYGKVKEQPSRELFDRLYEVTGGYAVPADACPTYEKTYKLLSELHRASV